MPGTPIHARLDAPSLRFDTHTSMHSSSSKKFPGKTKTDASQTGYPLSNWILKSGTNSVWPSPPT
eukprot:5471297-Ditylum_brightwellii.AAC.1